MEPAHRTLICTVSYPVRHKLLKPQKVQRQTTAHRVVLPLVLRCFCRPDIPAPAPTKEASPLAKTLCSTAFSIVETLLVLVVAAVALLVYRLNKDFRVPRVTCVQHSLLCICIASSQNLDTCQAIITNCIQAVLSS
ncbi:TPA: hypothetical protein ACH3X1_014308 [Trebouxia sp. C0004]